MVLSLAFYGAHGHAKKIGQQMLLWEQSPIASRKWSDARKEGGPRKNLKHVTATGWGVTAPKLTPGPRTYPGSASVSAKIPGYPGTLVGTYPGYPAY
eukprot:2947062-Rhodomonas_salina.2